MNQLWLLHRWNRNINWDEVSCFVIRAPSEADARVLAATNPGDEHAETWLDPTRSRAERLLDDGPTEVIVRDFRAG